MPIDPDSFKLGMRRLAASVCLITTQCTDGTRKGMTATAVCSVSMSPPTLLCCINRSNSSYEAIRQSGIFAVNILCVDDRPLADLFARPVPATEKFASGLWRIQSTGAPMLESALVAFDCALSQEVAVGTHGILFGEIQAVTTRKVAGKPLLYAHGAYGGFASMAEANDLAGLWIPTWDYEPN
ncbi:MAG TPA: flavin reductase family protein [Steroidobacteraceae bacterium]|nr:flavin reductase family protein [Steroidobacteraceae bacterium]